MNKILFSLACLAAFTGCEKKAHVTTTIPENPGIFVKKVNGLPDTFIRGVDISTVLAQEESGVIYRDRDGTPQDIFKTLRENGVNYIRVRVWNNPYDQNGNGFGGGNNDSAKAAEIGKRAAKYNLPLLVDFHYSDFWADPAKQQAPRAWKGMGIEEKSEALYAYTKESLEQIKKAGAIIGMVQIGNETTGAMCGETNWLQISKLMNAGSKAVRDFSKDVKVVVHFANPEKSGEYLRYAKILKNNEVDYDVFASSYYPFWHGTLDNLKTVLRQVAEFSGKKVMVAEFSYVNTYQDFDGSGNSISEDSAIDKPYSVSVQGQADCIREIIAATASLGDKALGVFYWEPAWIPVPGNTKEERQLLWEKYGSGWASSYAAVYDPDDAGKYWGGSAWDNQALFDAEGKPLASLATFGLAGRGASTQVKADSAEEQNIRVRLGDSLELPTEVSVINNDGSKTNASVTWNSKTEDGKEVSTLTKSGNGPAEYKVYGSVQGITVLAKIAVIEPNYLENPSFEEKDLSMWKWEDLTGKMKELKIEDNKNNAKSGTKSLHFWSDTAVNFHVEQTVTGLKPGLYKFSLVIHGGDAGASDAQDIKIFAKSGGKEYQEKTSADGWRNFRTPDIRGIKVGADGKATVGASVNLKAGSWGNLDDFVLTPQ
jgi:arabinogalactan endo-1,4-beta-galactosidase